MARREDLRVEDVPERFAIETAQRFVMEDAGGVDHSANCRAAALPEKRRQARLVGNVDAGVFDLGADRPDLSRRGPAEKNQMTRSPINHPSRDREPKPARTACDQVRGIRAQRFKRDATGRVSLFRGKAAAALAALQGERTRRRRA